MDATRNEVTGLSVTAYPTLMYYAKDNKTHPIEYGGEITLEELEIFLGVASTNLRNYLGIE